MSVRDYLIAQYRFKCESLKLIARTTQEICNHSDVAHWPGAYPSGTVTNPRRVCMGCGLEEVGSFWSSEHSWRVEEGEAKLGVRGPNVIHDDVVFFSLRLPVSIKP